MSEPMKYRIKVEPIDETAEELRAEYRMGIECMGFAIIADKGEEGTSISVHQMSDIDIAFGLNDDMMLKAAYIAVAMAEGDRMVKSRHERRRALNLADIRKMFGEED